MKLSVVIVNYNVKYYVEQCLNSLFAAIGDRLEAEVFVVDNHSRDGSADYLAARFPQINLIRSNHNLGFARANNIAIKQSRGEYILLLNPDTVVAEETLTEVVEFMDRTSDAGALGVQMLNTSGRPAPESRRGLPSPLVAFYKMAGLCSLFPSHKRFGHYYMSGLPWGEAARIEVVSGAFCLMRKGAVEKAGALDEDFFMYGEDIDLSYRILKAGYHNYYHPALILHYKGESTQKSSFRYVHVFYEAMLIFLRKHYPGLSRLFTLPVKLTIYAKATAVLVSMIVARCRKNLGFVDPGQHQRERYVFIGKSDMLSVCRQIADQHALQAEYIEADGKTRPEGHLDSLVQQDCLREAYIYYMVYDTDAYTYGQILSLFARQPADNAKMAFYDGTGTPRIITEREIYTA